MGIKGEGGWMKGCVQGWMDGVGEWRGMYDNRWMDRCIKGVEGYVWREEGMETAGCIENMYGVDGRMYGWREGEMEGCMSVYGDGGMARRMWMEEWGRGGHLPQL